MTRHEDLGARLALLLSVMTPPRILTSQEAQDYETRALMRAIDRVAPRDGLDGWWPQFEDALRSAMKTRAWPTVEEIESAAAAMVARSRAASGQTYGATPVADELAYQRFVEFWGLTNSVRRGTPPEFLIRAVKEGLATWGAFRWQGCDIPRWAFEIADRENRALSDAHMAALSESTRHLREHGAPRGDIRRAVA